MVTQAAEHADEFLRISIKLLKNLLVNEPLFAGNESLADELVKRANRKFDKPCKILPR